MIAFRWLLVACQAATILISWPLWQRHASPPLLPALPLPQVPIGALLLGSLLLVRVRVGLIAHSLLLLAAVLMDQSRLQPEVVSLAFLLWATLPSGGARAFGRAHLVTLWLYAGLNKLVSPAFMHGTAQWMLDGLYPDAPARLRDNFGYVVALAEFGVGLLALLPWTRRVAALAALALHTGILLDLSPVGHHYNEIIWPWNVALAAAAFALIWPWRGSPWRTFLACRPAVRVLITLLVVAPLGFYALLTDAYLAHNLYSSNTVTAERCDARGFCRPGTFVIETLEAFNAPLPPEHRLFRASFAKTCTAGERLVLHDPRWLAARRGLARQEVVCPR